MVKFLKLKNGNYVSTKYIFSVYAIETAPSSGLWKIDVAGGEDGSITIGTLNTHEFDSETKAQQFIQQVVGGVDPESYTDL